MLSTPCVFLLVYCKNHKFLLPFKSVILLHSWWVQKNQICNFHLVFDKSFFICVFLCPAMQNQIFNSIHGDTSCKQFANTNTLNCYNNENVNFHHVCIWHIGFFLNQDDAGHNDRNMILDHVCTPIRFYNRTNNFHCNCNREHIVH